ncbi:gp53-like domain-containing protein [Escherichia coli]|uniref:gp53-like domain-containing protein n=1 Tax=Escherichia coli TaxID=562 RepID=UPI00388F4583
MLRIGQVEATATQDGKYTDGSVAGGIAATRLRAAAFNAMQEELAHIVESAGLALDINDMTQVLKAIQKLTLSRANPFADIKSDGAAAISTALTNLGLGDISAAGVATGSLGSAGYATFPILISGVRQTFIMQWGILTPLRSGGTVDINLPIAFPTAAMQAYATHDNTTQITRPTVYAISTTSRTTITATAICLNTESVGAAATRSSDEVACYGRYFVIGY